MKVKVNWNRKLKKNLNFFPKNFKILIKYKKLKICTKIRKQIWKMDLKKITKKDLKIRK